VAAKREQPILPAIPGLGRKMLEQPILPAIPGLGRKMLEQPILPAIPGLGRKMLEQPILPAIPGLGRKMLQEQVCAHWQAGCQCTCGACSKAVRTPSAWAWRAFRTVASRNEATPICWLTVSPRARVQQLLEAAGQELLTDTRACLQQPRLPPQAPASGVLASAVQVRVCWRATAALRTTTST